VKKQTRRLLALCLVLTLVLANIAVTQHAHAAGYLTNSYVRLNRMTAGTGTSFRLVFKTNATTNAATSIAVNFNGADTTTWTGSTGAVNTTQSVSSATCAAEVTGATALPGTLTAAGAGSTVTISAITASLTVSTVYCVDLTSLTAVTTATAGEYHPTITFGVDTNTVAIRTITNDQVVVSAVVLPTFNLALSGTTDSFTTNLTTGAVTDTTGVTATVNTNAKTGWFAWAKDLNTGLTSATQSKTIAATTPGTFTTLASGSEGYVMGITSITQGSGAGVTSPVAAYDGSGGAGKGSGLDANIRQIAQSTGTANGAILTLKERAGISSITPAAADYTDTITILAAGSF
jgi:hypothetical protein